jgi:hypothetical protein
MQGRKKGDENTLDYKPIRPVDIFSQSGLAEESHISRKGPPVASLPHAAQGRCGLWEVCPPKHGNRFQSPAELAISQCWQSDLSDHVCGQPAVNNSTKKIKHRQNGAI